MPVAVGVDLKGNIEIRNLLSSTLIIGIQDVSKS